MEEQEEQVKQPKRILAQCYNCGNHKGEFFKVGDKRLIGYTCDGCRVSPNPTVPSGHFDQLKEVSDPQERIDEWATCRDCGVTNRDCTCRKCGHCGAKEHRCTCEEGAEQRRLRSKLTREDVLEGERPSVRSIHRASLAFVEEPFTSFRIAGHTFLHSDEYNLRSTSSLRSAPTGILEEMLDDLDQQYECHHMLWQTTHSRQAELWMLKLDQVRNRVQEAIVWQENAANDIAEAEAELRVLEARDIETSTITAATIDPAWLQDTESQYDDH